MRRWFSGIICVLVTLVLLLPLLQGASAESPRLLSAKVSPTAGDDMDSYVFTVRYMDADNDAPISMVVYLDGVAHDMGPVDGKDDNYTDGRDYSYRTRLSEGTYVYYFKSSDGENETQTPAYTVYVKSTSIIRMEHSDIIRMLILVSPIALAVMLLIAAQLWRINRSLRAIAGRKGAGGGKDHDPARDERRVSGAVEGKAPEEGDEGGHPEDEMKGAG